VLGKRIEEVSLNSWPALQQVLFDGWVLRFSRGYTKRANSVNSLYVSSMNVGEKIEICEGFYAERGLVPIFRITPFSSPPALDRVLAGREYRRIDPTSVLYLDLGSWSHSVLSKAELHPELLDEWMEAFCRLSRTAVDMHRTHKEILQAIPSRRFLGSLWQDGQVVACGLGVLENEYFGLFDLITDPELRGKGYGTRLLFGLLDWARGQGAVHAYLQVMRSNVPAQRLYQKLGFREVYSYWYRVPEIG
jgi:ribosomal protein S18 acetylase RimI-like enzyme